MAEGAAALPSKASIMINNYSLRLFSQIMMNDLNQRGADKGRDILKQTIGA
jgi:hypothetical protein